MSCECAFAGCFGWTVASEVLHVSVLCVSCAIAPSIESINQMDGWRGRNPLRAGAAATRRSDGLCGMCMGTVCTDEYLLCDLFVQRSSCAFNT